MVILHDDDYYASRKPEEDLGPFRNFGRFLWDSDKKTVLGRTAREWGELGIFYSFFFLVLGSIFAIQLWLSVRFVMQLDEPYFQNYFISRESVARNKLRIYRSPRSFDSPGIVFKPNSPLATTSPIIWVTETNFNAKPKRYIRALTDFLQEYKKNTSNYNLQCSDVELDPNYSGKPCFFDIKTLGACSKPPYGYTKPFQPCVLIKYNKRFHWRPHYYNTSSALPENMPQFLKQAVQSTKKFRIWLSCNGADNVDKEHIGEIDYIPDPGFPIAYFPFTGEPDYLSPMVALQFKNLTPNRLVTVECSLWAFNIDQHSRYSLDFQIMVDE